MFIDFLIERFKENRNKDAIIWDDTIHSYEWLLKRLNEWKSVVQSERVKSGAVTILEADFSPNAVALFLALIECGCVLVPLTGLVESQRSEYVRIAQGEVSFGIDKADNVSICRLPSVADHELYKELKNRNHPGLVLFSSGSTGKSKASVHDFVPLLEKFTLKRESLRTITFLLYDHIGGVNTMLYTLSNGGCIITVRDRSPDGVLGAVEKYRVELLPTSPTFMNLVLLSEAYKHHNLESLRIVTYGTEPMPETTLKRFHGRLPGVRLLQTYGLSEVGILRSKSKSSNSLWVKVGGEGYETRIVDRVLQVKARSAMLGYLNAPSPFTEDGWLDTGDSVETDGEYIRILGRKSEIINVGGEKVFPAEVENVIQEIESINEVTVYGEPNPIMGNIVCAKISLLHPEKPENVRTRIWEHCSQRLERYKIPVRISVVADKQHSDRFKKLRSNLSAI